MTSRMRLCCCCCCRCCYRPECACAARSRRPPLASRARCATQASKLLERVHAEAEGCGERLRLLERHLLSLRLTPLDHDAVELVATIAQVLYAEGYHDTTHLHELDAVFWLTQRAGEITHQARTHQACTMCKSCCTSGEAYLDAGGARGWWSEGRCRRDGRSHRGEVPADYVC